ncbi:DUF402 domain-containing protein [Streptacidiphilus sp. ASG 303]|uniref:DUF402 domain-containing protein n=1 Tax=Streptacidiphilus sp. ASG 303 TaxID=2896847 RepID=UPI001E5DC2D2|nr:DUF402 domain-containing protein [Streptacidiphilus sp. ASG 303]MCD0484897.1 DUF402 domain-containing protein [Streptacidiphilus sp. ASG 303]
METRAGRTLRRNLHPGGRLSTVVPVRVVGHARNGLLLRMSAGSPAWCVDLPDGVHLRDIPPEGRPEGGYPLRAVRWYRDNALIHQPRDGLHAVGWLFTQDLRFDGWYVDLERRIRRGDHIDVIDLEPDLVVAPDRTWRWKDEESSAARTGHPAYWSEEAEAIRPRTRA